MLLIAFCFSLMIEYPFHSQRTFQRPNDLTVDNRQPNFPWDDS